MTNPINSCLRHYWIIGKLVADLLFVLVGFLWFVPWIERMVKTSLAMDWFLAVDPGYTAAMQLHMVMAATQALLVFVLIVISVFKPWGRTSVNW